MIKLWENKRSREKKKRPEIRWMEGNRTEPNPGSPLCVLIGSPVLTCQRRRRRSRQRDRGMESSALLLLLSSSRSTNTSCGLHQADCTAARLPDTMALSTVPAWTEPGPAVDAAHHPTVGTLFAEWVGTAQGSGSLTSLSAWCAVLLVRPRRRFGPSGV